MKKEEILKAAIKKAKKNGYVLPEVYKSIFEELDLGYDRMDELWWRPGGYCGLIFSHDFAKAFWYKTKEGSQQRCVHCDSYPEESIYSVRKNVAKYCEDCGKIQKIEEIVSDDWEYRLQTMVLEEYPIEYLEQFLTSKK